MVNTKVKGKCKYCGKEYEKGYMMRHLTSCKARLKRLETETGQKQCGYFELVIYGKYDPDYWLIIEVKDTATLKDVDSFLRDIWLECCGHMSSFEINGTTYDSAAASAMEFFGNMCIKSMNCRLKTVIQKGMRFSYEYDFGTSTDLVIQVAGYRMGYNNEMLTILSRNNLIEHSCDACGKNAAVYVDPNRMYDGDPFLCEECSELPEYDVEYLLKVCNSPRMGECGYDGSSIYPDRFVPDAEI